MAATVFVIDDDASVREAIHRTVESVGLRAETFASPQEFLSTQLPQGPRCLVLDVRLPGSSGLDLQDELAKAKIEMPIIFITGFGDIPMSVRAMKGGAVEFLTKPFREQDLVDAIQLALEADRHRGEGHAGLDTLRQRFAGLSDRERQVMAMVVTGKRNREIAATLRLSEITVKKQRGRLMLKMEAKSVADLARMAERLGLPAYTS
jgi:FixJ family two-component response regulator